MWFNHVPEPKAAKNRLHFDLRDRPELNAQRSLGRPLTATSSTNPSEPWKSAGLAV